MENQTPRHIANYDEIHHCTRAKYIPQADGSLRLVAVQQFNQPRFCESGWELSDRDRQALETAGIVDESVEEGENSPKHDAKDVIRAARRARIRTFDTILCNPDLDTFATFTYRPEDDFQKASYSDCYGILKPWLSNRVQRNGLKYIVVPERHKSGDIHFHGIMNSSALKLERALSPYTGRPLTRKGAAVYNLRDWRAGFSTAQIIGGGDLDREKVAKYIWKYMNKQSFQTIGGRYALVGGHSIARPVYAYGQTADEFIIDQAPTFQRHVQIGDNLEYTELSFM